MLISLRYELSSLTERRVVQTVEAVQIVQIVASDLKPREWSFDLLRR